MDERPHEPRLTNCQIIDLWSSLHTLNWDNASKGRLRPRKFCGSGLVSRLPHEVERAGFLVTQKFAINPQIVDPRDLGCAAGRVRARSTLVLRKARFEPQASKSGRRWYRCLGGGHAESFNPPRNGPMQPMAEHGHRQF